MRICGYFRAAVLAATILFPLIAIGATAPAYTPGFGSRVGTVITDKISQRGFAANDPRYQATLRVVTTTVAAAATAAGGNAAWLSALPRLGIAAAVTVAVPLAVNYLIQHNTDGTVVLSGSGMGPTQSVDPSSGVIAGGAYWGASEGGVKGGDPYSVGFQGVVNGYIAPGSAYDAVISFSCYVFSATRTNCDYTMRFRNSQSSSSPRVVYVDKYASGAPISCPSGSYISAANICIGYAFSLAGQSAYPSTAITPEQALIDLPQSSLALALDPDLQSKIANYLWQNASQQPGFDGIPYDPSFPITQSDIPVSPSITVSDYLSPAVGPDGVVLPGQTASPVIQPPVGATKIDLGPDPVIAPPTLENPPTGLAILQPLLNLFPSLKNFSVPSHSSVCPSGTFQVWGNNFVFDQHCNLFEQFRSVIYAGFLLFWTIASLKIILEA